MPLYFAAQAGVARLTGDYLLAGKLLSLLAAAACGALLFAVLLRAECPWALALGLAGLTLADTVGFNATTTVRADLLAALWQVAALAVASGRPTRISALFAAALGVLGVLTKVSALWGPLAIVAFSWRRDRRWCALFAACWLGALILAVAALHFGTGGRMLANFRVASEPVGAFLLLLLKSPFRMLLFIAKDCPLLFLLTPFVAVEVCRAWREARLTVYHYGLFFCAPLLLVTFADRGTVSNHLIDLVLLSVVLVGLLWRSLGPWQGVAGGGPALVLLAVLWGLWLLWAGNLGHAARDLLTHAHGGFSWRPYKPLAAQIGDDESVLTEDALIEVSRGHRPVVLDPYMLTYLEQRQPDAVARLAERLRAREFAHVVLRGRPDLPAGEEDRYRQHFGPTVVGAIREAYQFDAEAEGLYLFKPRPKE
jgi:hypothetical protein